MAIGLRENDSDWRDWVNWALQRPWADGTYQALYKKHYRMDLPFSLGDAGRPQPGVDTVAQEAYSCMRRASRPPPGRGCPTAGGRACPCRSHRGRHVSVKHT